jgi:hypothetical protein
MITYEEYKQRVFEVAMKTEFKELSEQEVLEYFKKEEKYIRDMYESDTNEDKFRAVYGKRNDFKEKLARFKNGDYLESGIHGTVYGLSMMW